MPGLVTENQRVLDFRQDGFAVDDDSVQVQGNGQAVVKIAGREPGQPMRTSDDGGSIVRYSQAVGIIGRFSAFQYKDTAIGCNARIIKTRCNPDVAVSVAGNGTDAFVSTVSAQLYDFQTPVAGRITPDALVPGTDPPDSLAVFPDTGRGRALQFFLGEETVVFQEPEPVFAEEIRLPGSELSAEPEVGMGKDLDFRFFSFRRKAQDGMTLEQVNISSGVVPDTVAGLYRPFLYQGHGVTVKFIFS